MDHVIVLPKEFIEKLSEAYSKNEIHSKWLDINVDTVEDMINRIISKLNSTYPKLNVKKYRVISKDDIKERLHNKGNSSKFTGYFEREDGEIDAMIFYIPPSLNSANDFLSRQVLPTLLGIYKGNPLKAADLHFNNMPIYILNINETGRSDQLSVKKNIICAEILNWNYLDIFEREYRDIIDNKLMKYQDMTLVQYNNFLLFSSGSELFTVDENVQELKLLLSQVTASANPAAEIYRYCLKVLPAIYIAVNQDYHIIVEGLNKTMTNGVDILNKYVNNFKKK